MESKWTLKQLWRAYRAVKRIYNENRTTQGELILFQLKRAIREFK